MRIPMAAICVFTVSGCSSLPAIVAGRAGCPEIEVQIVESSSGWGLSPSTYTAQCRGRKFVCSVGAEQDLDKMVCSPMLASNSRQYGDEGMRASSQKSKSFDVFVEEINEKAESR